MKVIIAGSRTASATCVLHAMDHFCLDKLSNNYPTEVVSGGARGADSYGKSWAEARKIPVREFQAQWQEHGRRAGPIRNRQMADYADALVAVWDGASRGTKNMIEEMQIRGKLVFIFRFDQSRSKTEALEADRPC